MHLLTWQVPRQQILSKSTFLSPKRTNWEIIIVESLNIAVMYITMNAAVLVGKTYPVILATLSCAALAGCQGVVNATSLATVSTRALSNIRSGTMLHILIASKSQNKIEASCSYRHVYTVGTPTALK